MTARYDAEVAMLRNQPSPMLTRIRHDADELRRLADWLIILREELPPLALLGTANNAVALDYFRLSATLRRLSEEHYNFALTLTRPIP